MTLRDATLLDVTAKAPTPGRRRFAEGGVGVITRSFDPMALPRRLAEPVWLP